MKNLFGRKVIYTSCSDLNLNSIVKVVNGAMLRHDENSRQIAYLEKYFTGKQPILNRNKVIRQDVNNKIVVNNAYSIVRNANGYFLGEPIKYASKDAECRENVEILNNMMDSIDKACGDTQLGEWQSICSTAYRLICVDEDGENNDTESIPFSVPILDPKYTSVIYSAEAQHKPILAFTYCDILDDNGNPTGRKYTVYDKTYQYIFETKGVNSQIKVEDLLQDYPKPHFLGDIPIIEYPNNQWRLGDF
jgi:Phage portal protein, SPP1 Gp6-like.